MPLDEKAKIVEGIMDAKERLDNVFNQWSDGAVTALELQTYVINLNVAINNLMVCEAFPDNPE